MSVDVRANRDGDRIRLAPAGSFDLAHAAAAAHAIAQAEPALRGSGAIEIDLAAVETMDGSGAVQLARLIDRLEASNARVKVVAGAQREAARLIALYRERRSGTPAAAPRALGVFGQIGASISQVPAAISGALDFTGHSLAALSKAAVSVRSVDWRSLPRLVQGIGADGLLVASAANLLIGLIIGFLGVSQLARFGATVYVPELVVVAQFRELGPLVTAIVVAGRAGAGRASGLATM
jgi:phospholipid/cholesterol/gamma-HCH transport system permease protein